MNIVLLMVSRFTFFFLCVAALLASRVSADARDAERLSNRPELSLPLVAGKPVVAHFMTDLIHYREVGQGDINSPAMYWRDGVSRDFGGMIQHFPMAAQLRPDVSLKEAVAFEMRAAKRLGVDGFQFYYPLSKNEAFTQRCVEIIKSFFEVAEREYPDFKLTLCLCNPQLEGTEDEKIANWSESIGQIIAATKNSRNWLKTPDGRYIFFQWIGDSLADSVPFHWKVQSDPKLVGDVAVAYQKLANKIGIPIAWVYHMRWPKDRNHLSAVLDYFPGIWGWTDSYQPDDGWEPVAAYCRERARAYTQTLYSDYYTSKLYRRGEPNRMIFSYREARELGLEQVERHYQVCHLSFLFRKLWERAIEVDAPMVNLVTWNDFPEGHHLAPEINHNFGFSLLLQHYKAQWRGIANDMPESAIVFFKKYRHDVEPDPFAIPIHIKAAVGDESSEDVIEIVTLLKLPGELSIDGIRIGEVSGGLQIHEMPSRPGRVHVTVSRNAQNIIDFTTPEAITAKPYRTDRLTYAYSSEFGTIFQDLFGDSEPFTSREYGKVQRERDARRNETEQDAAEQPATAGESK